MKITTIEQLRKKTAAQSSRSVIDKQHQDIIFLSAETFLANDVPVFISLHESRHNQQRHHHDFFEINYVVQGNPVVDINGQEMSLKQSNLALMNPNANHYFKKYKDGEDVVINIVFPTNTFHKNVFIPLLSNPDLNAFFIRYQIESQRRASYLFLSEPDPELETVIEILIKEYLNIRNGNYTIIESLITVIFSYMLRSFTKLAEGIISPIDTVINEIYRHYDHCSLKELANKYGYHPKYLSTLIRKYTGISYRDLIVKIRLMNAEQYLLHSSLSIEDIIDMIGYQDKSVFYQHFKKTFGVSPAVYRKANQK